MIARSAIGAKPRAIGAPLCGNWGLTRSARSHAKAFEGDDCVPTVSITIPLYRKLELEYDSNSYAVSRRLTSILEES